MSIANSTSIRLVLMDGATVDRAALLGRAGAGPWEAGGMGRSRRNDFIEQSAPSATIRAMSGISFMHFLPCLRCGRDSVGVSLLTGATRRENVWCLAQGCEAVHYLRIGPDAEGLDVVYDRYSVGAPLEAYDEGNAPRSPQGRKSRQKQDEDGFSGSVSVFPRKKRYSDAEAKTVWTASAGRCHLCGKHWKPTERGKEGWQVDNVIPTSSWRKRTGRPACVSPARPASLAGAGTAGRPTSRGRSATW